MARNAGRRPASGVIFSAQPFVRLWSAGGFLLQVACSAQCPPCYASRSRGEAGSDTQGGQKGKPGLGILSTTPCIPLNVRRQQPSDQVAGARFPFSGMGIARYTIGAQKPRPSAGIHSQVACISRSSCRLRRSEPSCHAALRTGLRKAIAECRSSAATSWSWLASLARFFANLSRRLGCGGAGKRRARRAAAAAVRRDYWSSRVAAFLARHWLG